MRSRASKVTRAFALALYTAIAVPGNGLHALPGCGHEFCGCDEGATRGWLAAGGRPSSSAEACRRCSGNCHHGQQTTEDHDEATHERPTQRDEDKHRCPICDWVAHGQGPAPVLETLVGPSLTIALRSEGTASPPRLSRLVARARGPPSLAV